MKLLIVGASVRAAVQSALRAGHFVTAYDLFADADTRRMCDETSEAGNQLRGTIDRVDSFTQLIEIARQAQTSPDRIIVTGGVENYPNVMTALAEWAPIAGCSGGMVARLNDWQRVAPFVSQTGCRLTETYAQLPAAAKPDQWLRKPIAGSGGIGIRVAPQADQAKPRPSGPANHYFQKRVVGDSVSALFMTTNGATKLIGVTEQWVGHPSLTNSLFAYCGSIGPILLPEKTAFPIIKLGRAIAEQYQVEGVFGIDFLINADGVFPVDVNPRITASAEVFERWDHTRSVARPFNAVEAQLGHWRPASERGHRLIDGSPFACALGRGLETSSNESLGDNLVCGKAIVFNQTDSSITVAQRATDRLLLLNERDDEVSDVPTPKTVIHRDEPMVTVHAQGANRETVARKLIAAAERARSILVD